MKFRIETVTDAVSEKVSIDFYDTETATVPIQTTGPIYPDQNTAEAEVRKMISETTDNTSNQFCGTICAFSREIFEKSICLSKWQGSSVWAFIWVWRNFYDIKALSPC